MKIKHFAGYGCVNAHKVQKDYSVRLHIVVEGNHEWGIIREDEYDLWNWLVRRFEHDVCSYEEWHKMNPKIKIVPDHGIDLSTGMEIDRCHYYFEY